MAMEKGQAGGVYNIGGGSQVTINHCIESMEIIVGKKANVKRLERQKGDVTHTYADTTRAQKELGFQPSTPLDEGLRLEAKWIQDNIL